MPPPRKTKKSESQHSKRAPAAALPARNTSHVVVASTTPLHALPLELQQAILNVFITAFPISHNAERLTQVTQEIKGYLFKRDFASAFGQPAYLQAYALRWSAARALGYSHILTHPDRASILTTTFATSVKREDDHVELQARDLSDPIASTPPRRVSTKIGPRKVVCLGGGAGAEIVAFATAHRQLDPKSLLEIIAVDNADWSDSVAKIWPALSTAPALSAHASVAAKEKIENRPLLEDSSMVTVSFNHQDVLTWNLESMKQKMQDASLCTIMFTLNELFTMPVGSYLLVIDSPGSYSEIQLGKTTSVDGLAMTPTTKYPMKWLLDHTLLEVARSGDKVTWKKMESEDSLWFRIDQKERDRLRYPVELENMRYQLHLYRKI
ncbi:hypothetical protein LTR70_002962 [Exophiala xenobiotica]|uniref:Uncharacterized protein n=1 Tax=Lithohypha guttulata TaxID=1690604 RepID=A0ABR0K7B2_9EURO|nr:hypothetical protein LTR24_006515 [Lithohypha guttulata]KAK5324332.1 hypothetical protein LTR70_002962 [Exophiala xenobiotica]